eukprot:1886753-Amphidinium_carterae.1
MFSITGTLVVEFVFLLYKRVFSLLRPSGDSAWAFVFSVASTLDTRRFAHIQLITSNGGYLVSSIEEVSVNHKTPNDNYNGNENVFWITVGGVFR